MPSEKAKLALLDIRDNNLLAQQFTQGISFEEFANSRLHFYAVTHALEIVSEASRRLPESFRAKHATLPWKKIMGVGNIYRHSCDNVKEAFVWSTVQEHLASLLAVAVAEIQPRVMIYG
jgi:uncharacterized protein with HEPN domain